MKRGCFLVCVFAIMSLATMPAHAQVWQTANEATIAWDAVTKLLDGSTIPTTDQVRYNVFIKNKKTGTVTPIGSTPNLQHTIVFSLEGRYFPGVSAVRLVIAEDGVTVEETMESEVSWSDNPEVCYQGQTFGIRYFVHPNQPRGLRK